MACLAARRSACVQGFHVASISRISMNSLSKAMAAHDCIDVLSSASQHKGISFFATLVQALVTMCAGASMVAALPSMIHQIMSPSPRGLLMGMANSALAFFLFSYQASQ